MSGKSICVKCIMQKLTCVVEVKEQRLVFLGSREYSHVCFGLKRKPRPDHARLWQPECI